MNERVAVMVVLVVVDYSGTGAYDATRSFMDLTARLGIVRRVDDPSYAIGPRRALVLYV